MSKLEIIIGPMCSGKTSELIKRARWHTQFKKVLIINSRFDNRSEDTIKTHDNIVFPATKVNKLSELDNLVFDYDVLCIDEAQFFSDLYKTVIKWLNKDKIIIIIASLDGDSDQNKFGSVLDLIPLSDSVRKYHALCAICKDGTPAPFTITKKKKNSQILIGDTHEYTPVCRKHLNK